jgi:hypothetical protein
MSPYGVLTDSIQCLLKSAPQTLNDLISGAEQAGLTAGHARRVVGTLTMGGKVTSKQHGSEILVCWLEGDV